MKGLRALVIQTFSASMFESESCRHSIVKNKGFSAIHHAKIDKLKKQMKDNEEKIVEMEMENMITRQMEIET